MIRRRGKAKERWLRKALFVDISKMKIIFERTEKPKKPKRQKRLPSWITKERDEGFPTRRQQFTLHNTRATCELLVHDRKSYRRREDDKLARYVH